MDTHLNMDAKCPRCGADLDRILKTTDFQSSAVTLTFVHEDESEHQVAGDLRAMDAMFRELTEPA